MKQSLRTRIVIIFTFIMIIVIAGQVIFNLFFAKNYFIREKEKSIEKLYNDIEKSYEDSVESIHEITGQAEETEGIKVYIFSNNGVLYANSYDTLIGAGVYFLGTDDLKLTLGDFGEKPKVEISQRSDNDRAQVILRGKFTYNGEERYVMLALPVESIESSIALFNQSTLLISAIVFVLGLFLIWFVTSGITKPIKSMEEVSKRMAALDFSNKVSEKASTRELQSLAKSINSMSEQLDESITDLQQANIQLQKDINKRKQLEDMRKQFIANVSHEMKTPLALMQVYCENLKGGIAKDDMDYYCDTIIEESTRLDDMVKSMLDVSAIENGLSKMSLEKLDFSKLCQTVVEHMKPLAKENIMEAEIEPGIEVIGSNSYLEMAVKNYINNAISHCIKGGRIRVILHSTSGGAKLEVYNDGATISNDDQAHIWDSFFKSDASRTRVDGVNAGLGLYIVRTVADKHFGTCEVENGDHGVTFKMTIPVVNLETLNKKV